MYKIEYDVKIFNSIIPDMKSSESFNGYQKEMSILRVMLDEGIKMTPEYLDSITLEELDDMIDLIDDLINEGDTGLLQEMSNVSTAKLVLSELKTNRDAVLDDEDFF